MQQLLKLKSQQTHEGELIIMAHLGLQSLLMMRLWFATVL